MEQAHLINWTMKLDFLVFSSNRKTDTQGICGKGVNIRSLWYGLENTIWKHPQTTEITIFTKVDNSFCSDLKAFITRCLSLKPENQQENQFVCKFPIFSMRWFRLQIGIISAPQQIIIWYFGLITQLWDAWIYHTHTLIWNFWSLFHSPGSAVENVLKKILGPLPTGLVSAQLILLKPKLEIRWDHYTFIQAELWLIIE